MKKLLSLPPNLVDCFHDVTGHDPAEWYCTNDPVGAKLGSGGGTVNVLRGCYQAENTDEIGHSGHSGSSAAFGIDALQAWLPREKRIILHAGGQSRRLPAYAPSGKVLTPIPVFRWERGQRLSQDLLSLQVPFYESIMRQAPDSLHTMIVSGDVLIRATEPLQHIPEADVVCYGLWLGPEIACDHGVFVSSHSDPQRLECMLQKPSRQKLEELAVDHYYLTDIGLWLLSDRAVEVLCRKSLRPDGSIAPYDLYGEFGCALGTRPTIKDTLVAGLSVAVMPLPGGEFYHFGTSHEILSSMMAIQNIVTDQRQIIHHSRKPHPAMFVQNAITKVKITADNYNLWVENSYIGEHWTLSHDNIITGVPQNDWALRLLPGQCIDIVPLGESEWVVRPYGYNDKFRGNLLLREPVLYLGKPFSEWAAARGIDIESIDGTDDFQSARIFPVARSIDEIGIFCSFMLSAPDSAEGRQLWLKTRKLSADDISARANLRRLVAQRRAFRMANLPMLAKNYRHSVFYQLDLDSVAHDYAAAGMPMPEPLPEDENLMLRMRDAMLRADDHKAFGLLREALTLGVRPSEPRLSVCADQIVWGRSPVRIDIAGGWTDTPPFCLTDGGSVVNLAIDLNGQQPIQAYVKPCSDHHIILRSIDLGATEVVKTFDELGDFCHVGSPFSIPKAALALAGFLPRFCSERYPSLESQLQHFGCGIEVTLLSAIPAGSGLGTSSILAATVLGAVGDFCGLKWDKNEIGHRTLVLEQLLTTGGGWQDQFGGVLRGVKMLSTQQGFVQNPVVRYLPGDLFTLPEYRPCHLLFYTGITRTAKKILAEIVRRMFLSQHEQTMLLRQMKRHAEEMYDAIEMADFERMGRLVRRTWQQNQMLDSGTNPEAVEAITRLVDDLCLGYKLPGAGGGGYLYMIAKDPDAAARIRTVLNSNRPSPNARFVDMQLSQTGLQISRS